MTLKVQRRNYPLLDGTTRILPERVGDGSIITRFEKTPLPEKPTDVVCPHFLELKWATGCPYDCAWCYLKGTLRFAPSKAKPRVKDFTKIERHVRAFTETVDWCEELLNTGELSDSLMYERDGSSFSKFIMSIFNQQERHKVLFVTKSNRIDNLLQMNRKDRAIVSFSLNAEDVAEKFEHGATAVKERIEAAAKLDKAGYEVRIRIDPMVPVLGWENAYRQLVDGIFSKFTPSRITLGSLRGLQSTINEASDKSWVKYLSERSNWGKRIGFDIRLGMYKEIIDYLKSTTAYADVALCKETVEIWNRLNLDYKSIQCNCVP